MSINRCNLFLYAMIISLPFINFSIIPGSKLNLSYIVTLASAPFIIDLLRKTKLSSVDIAFTSFIVACCVTSVINHSAYAETKSLTQIVNFILCYALYFVTKTLLVNSERTPEHWLSVFYKYNNFIIILGLAVYLLGLIRPDLGHKIAIFSNNSGNYTYGGLSGTFTDFGPARSMGFSPEASFWGIYTAANFCVGALNFRKNWLFLAINFAAVLVTVSRTGYLLIGVFFSLIFIWRLKAYLPVMFLAVTLLAMIVDRDAIPLMDDASSIQRFDSIFFSGSLWLDRPLTGYGLGSFTGVALANQKDYRDIFSLHFYLLYSIGAIGYGIFVSLLFLLLKNVSRKDQVNLLVLFFAWVSTAAVNLPYIWFLASLFSMRQRVERPANLQTKQIFNIRNI